MLGRLLTEQKMNKRSSARIELGSVKLDVTQADPATFL